MFLFSHIETSANLVESYENSDFRLFVIAMDKELIIL